MHIKNITWIVVVAFLGLLILNKQFALTEYKIPLFSVPQGHVRVDFVNHSDEDIRSILFPLTESKIEDIKVGERRTILYEHSGEGIYLFTVNFNSGKQLIESERYVEGGYFMTEYIYNSQVKTEY